ncbi:MAG: phenylalanine 4-monooxygenase [Maricaulaceae bacterium]
MPINDPIITAQTHADDYVIEQRWDAYTEAEHAIWRTLYARQIDVLSGRACNEFYAGLEKLDLNDGGIPDLKRLNKSLKALTGWTVICVPHLIPDDVFFKHLSERRFPAGRFIRGADQLDYLQEPDIFHDVFGHVPLLAQPVFADYMQAYGAGGLRAMGSGQLKNLARLYWYTVEFGLMKAKNSDELCIYGAGIVSSRTESIFSLEDASPNRIGFDLERIMRTDYRIDDFQQSYFVIDSFEQLLNATQQDFGALYNRLSASDETHSVTDTLSADVIIHHGTQDYAKSKGAKSS